MSAQLFRVLKPITSRRDEPFKPGGLPLHASDLDGCDLGWLIRVGAIEPIDPKGVTRLYGDAPTAEDYAEEVRRLQSIIEAQQALIDGQAGELAAIRQYTPSGYLAAVAENPAADPTRVHFPAHPHPSIGSDKRTMNDPDAAAKLPRVRRFGDSEARELIDPAVAKAFPELAARAEAPDGETTTAEALAAAKRRIAELTAKLDAK